MSDIVENDMKKLLIIFLILLFLLSSCGYTAKEIDEIHEKWNEEYFALEEKYYEADERSVNLDMVLNRINEYYATAYCYYDDADPDVTEKEAHDAFLKIGELLRNAGY